jgi:ABC-type branched-subunit amino acid transport system substrate-binding protein
MAERTKSMLMALLGTLVVTLACTVGEGRTGPPAPREQPPEDSVAADEVVDVPLDSAVAAADDEASTDLLIRSQLAYETANVEEALTLAEHIVSEYPRTTAVESARWVGARAAFALGRYNRAQELALEYAEDQSESSGQAAEARALARLAEDALSPPASAPPIIGAILPRSGSRALVRYGDWILEGLQLAVDEVERQQGRPIELVVVDDAGGSETQRAVAELERRGAIAIIGPLLPQQLSVAANARRDPRLVLISPTATGAPEWPEAYSITRGDSRGSQELGRYAFDVGLRQAAVLHSRDPEHRLKARAFTVEYETLGGEIQAVVPYDSGTTTFGPHMEQILAAVAPGGPVRVTGPMLDSLVAYGLIADRAEAGLLPTDSLRALARMIRPGAPVSPEVVELWGGPPQEPFALFVAAPQRDVPQIAPQVAFYGLDSAGVQIFGDEAWANADVRRVVPNRDLEGVIAVSHFPPDRASGAADPAFVQRYEARYRKSLDNPLPALGYDAANMVLQALPNRLLTPDALARRFGFLTGIRGATGELSVRGNEVIRTPFLTVVRGGRLAPAPYPWEFEIPVPTPPKPDSADEESGRV